MDGRLDHGTRSYAPEHVSIPSVVESSWMPILGGVTDQSTPSDAYVALSRPSSTWFATATSLPYAASDHALVSLEASRSYLSTAGNTGTSSRQTGRLLSLTASGAVHPSVGFPSELTDPVLAAHPDGRLLVLGYTDTGASASRRIELYDPERETVQQLDQTSSSERARWSVTRTRGGDILFYTRPARGDSSPFQGTVVVVRAQSMTVETYDVSYPRTQRDQTGFDPVWVPAPGPDRFLLFDRVTGNAARVGLVKQQSPLTPTSISTWNLTWPFEVREIAVSPRSSSLIALGRSSQAPDEIRVIEWYPTCRSTFQGRDTDGDGEPNVSDNCPATPNASQKDADRDGIGNPCDGDADNDGIPNNGDVIGQQSVELDTDNDGIDNASDPDIDGDGIDNERDRYPFDTDNDGTPNRFDPDDDHDGYDDGEERQMGTNATNASSFPSAGHIASIRRDSSTGRRTLEVGTVSEFEAASTVVSSTQISPHDPAFYGDTRGVLALAGQPGQTSTIVWKDAQASSLMTRDLGAPLRDVEPLTVNDSGELVSIGVIKQRASKMPPTWEIASRSLKTAGFRTITRRFDDMRALDIGSNRRLLFLGGPLACPSCRAVYAIGARSGPLRLRFAPRRTPLALGFDGTRTTLVTNATSGANPPTSDVLHISEGSNQSFERLESPPFESIDSAVPLPSDGHVIVSARFERSTPYDLWLYNGIVERWIRLTSSSDDLIELDWTP